MLGAGSRALFTAAAAVALMCASFQCMGTCLADAPPSAAPPCHRHQQAPADSHPPACTHSVLVAETHISLETGHATLHLDLPPMAEPAAYSPFAVLADRSLPPLPGRAASLTVLRI
jgi:hypothetical protein